MVHKLEPLLWVQPTLFFSRYPLHLGPNYLSLEIYILVPFSCISIDCTIGIIDVLAIYPPACMRAEAEGVNC